MLLLYRPLSPPAIIMPQESLARHVALRATALFETLCSLLASGQLLVLKPGEKYHQERTAMLLQGSLLPPPDPASAEKQRDAAVEEGQLKPHVVMETPSMRFFEGDGDGRAHPAPASHEAPSLLLWSPDFFDAVHSRDAKGHAANDSVILVAGPRGAQLVVS